MWTLTFKKQFLGGTKEEEITQIDMIENCVNMWWIYSIYLNVEKFEQVRKLTCGKLEQNLKISLKDLKFPYVRN